MELKNLIGELHGRNRPQASLHLQAISTQYDTWLVGGAARWVLGGCRGEFPKDIDILVNLPESTVKVLQDNLIAQKAGEFDGGSGGQGQKYLHDDVQFDVFQNDLVKWLRGAPCRGDQLAIRLRDNFVLCSPMFFIGDLHARNPDWNGPEAYLDEHAKHVAACAESIARYISSLG